MTEHAKFSPSGAHRWMPCPGSLVLESELPEGPPSAYADEGTAAHEVAAMCLLENRDAGAYVGRLIEVQTKGEPVRTVEFTEDMAGHVQVYVDNTRREVGDDDELLVERRVEFGKRLGVEGQFGTADAIILRDDDSEIVVRDLKFGRGVKVMAVGNKQLRLYGLGALDRYNVFGEIERVRLVIDQPRLDHLDEEVVTVEELHGFAIEAAEAVAKVERAAACRIDPATQPGAFESLYLEPGEEQCRFCAAKAFCPALASYAARTVAGEFESLEEAPGQLSEADVAGVAWLNVETFEAFYERLGLVEQWAKAMHERALHEALSGNLSRFKAVQGRAGARRWANEHEAEEAMRAARIKQDVMYTRKLASPTQLEKAISKANPRKWAKLQELVVQSEGSPTVVPVDDKRPALLQAADVDEFEDLA